MARPRVVLFDLMDTLVRDPYHELFEKVLPAYDISPRRFLAFKRQDSFEEFEKGEIDESEFFRRYYKDDLAQSTRDALPRPEKLKKHMYRSVPLFPGIEELLRELRQPNPLQTSTQEGNVRLGIASNYSAWYHEIMRLRPELKEGFHYYFFSCEMGVRKPAPRYYETIYSALQNDLSDLQPRDLFFTDDRETNIAPARDMGWHVHHFQGGEGLHQAVGVFLNAGSGD